MTARELFDRGYLGISNRYGLVARIDRPDWIEYMAGQSFRSAAEYYVRTPDGRVTNDTGMWGEHYCRVHSRDQQEVPQGTYRALKALWAEHNSKIRYIP